MLLNCFVQIIILTHATTGYDNRVITSLKYSKNYVKPVVIHGEPASKGDVPYMVSIKQKALRANPKQALWRNYCGGAIIGPKKVLTASHCFENKNYDFAINRDTLRAVAGDLLTDRYQNPLTDSTDTQWRNIENIVMHKDYRFPLNDIALVFITVEWNYNNNVKSIPYARKNSDYMTWCTASGYGDMKHAVGARVSTRLLIAKMYTLPRYSCSKVWEMNMNSFVCTTSANSDVARGDSGGPLACKGTVEMRRETMNGILVGVVCGKNFDKTTLFTRVSTYKDFIENNSGFNLSTNVLFILTFLVFVLFFV